MSVLLLSNCRVAVKNFFKAVMVNNSTNINKMNNQLLLNTQYTMIYDVRNPGPGLGQTQRSGGIKQIDPNRSPLDSWISNNNSDIFIQ